MFRWHKLVDPPALLLFLALLDFGIYIFIHLQKVAPEINLQYNWRFSMTLEDGRLFRQWDIDGGEVSTRIGPEETPPFPSPGMSSFTGSSIKSYRSAELGPEQLADWDAGTHGIFFIHHAALDTPPVSFPHPVPATVTKRKTVVLLDASGTMSEASAPGKISPYRLALQKLSRNRQQRAEDWHMFTFADELLNHGIWRVGSHDILRSLPANPHGKTALLTALTGLAEAREVLGKDEADVIIVTDGAFSERDRPSLLRKCSEWRGRGHRLFFLSPEFEGIDRLAFLYQSGLAQPFWPGQEPVELVQNTTVTSSDGTAKLEWNDLPASLAGEGMQPLLYARDGKISVYFQFFRSRPTLHIVGTPGVDDATLLLAAGSGWKQAPVVVVDRHGLSVELSGSSLKSLSIVAGGESSEIPAQEPGRFRLDSESPLPSRIEMNHPLSGPVLLYDLDSLRPHYSLAEPPPKLWRWRDPDWGREHQINIFALLALHLGGFAFLLCRPFFKKDPSAQTES